MEHASDADFQAWLVESGLDGLVDDDGIAGWSFDDRVRVINFALRQGLKVPFVEREINSDNSPNNSEGELFGGDETPSQAV